MIDAIQQANSKQATPIKVKENKEGTDFNTKQSTVKSVKTDSKAEVKSMIMPSSFLHRFQNVPVMGYNKNGLETKYKSPSEKLEVKIATTIAKPKLLPKQDDLRYGRH